MSTGLAASTTGPSGSSRSYYRPHSRVGCRKIHRGSAARSRKRGNFGVVHCVAAQDSLRRQGPGKREGHRRGVPFLAPSFAEVGGRWIDSQWPVHCCLDRVLQFPVPSPQSSPGRPALSAQCPHGPVPQAINCLLLLCTVCVSRFAAEWHAAALCGGIGMPVGT